MDVRRRRDAIIRLLRRNGSATVDGLATSVGASRRTILRDIIALRDEGFVIHSESGRGGGVQLDPHSMQTTTRLSVTEVFALLISVAAMRAARSLPFAGLADQGLAKIERGLSAEKVRDLRRLIGCLYVGQLSPKQDVWTVGTADADLLGCFETAFLQQNLMTFEYRDAAGAVTGRLVEPQAMLILPPLWYLVAFDPSRDDFRRFRMDRISRPEVVDGSSFRRRHVPFEDDVCPYTDLPNPTTGEAR